MTYLVNHNQPARRHKKMLASIFTAVVIVCLIIVRFAPHFIPSIFTTIARPFWRMEFSLQSGALRSPEALLNENEDLKRQLTDLTVRMQSTSILEQENSDLEAMLGRTINFASSTATSTATGTTTTSLTLSAKLAPKTNAKVKTLFVQPVLSAVLAHPPFAPYDELVIDIGSDYAVTVGNNVYAPGNVLIGHISDVLSNTSKVELLSSPSNSFEVLIGSQTVTATAHGRGGGQYSAELSHDAVVQVGDLVIMPSIDRTVVGIVGAVVTDPANSFETVLFAPPASIYGLRWVMVNTSLPVTH